MNSIYDKPFVPYEEMIDMMRKRGIVIENEAFAIESLKTYSYYTLLNGYKETFRVSPQSDTFNAGTHFEDLYLVHTMDVSIGSIVLKYILYIEQALKSNLSYIIAKNYGVYTDPNVAVHLDPSDYLCRDHYSKRNKMRNNTLRHLSSILDINNKSGYASPSLLHYFKHHNHIPPWILTTSLTLGEISRWYDILNASDKNYVCASMLNVPSLDINARKEFLKKVLELLREFRNSTAHGSRTYLHIGDTQIPKRPLVSLSDGLVTSNEYNKSDSSKIGLHAVLGSIYILLSDHWLRREYVLDLTLFFMRYKDFDTSGMDIYEVLRLPSNFGDRLNKLFEKC